MANQTVYPYGTGGELPSSIGIINDLTTGGVNKALSAEMGKTLNGNLTQLGQKVDEFTSADFAQYPGWMMDNSGTYVNGWGKSFSVIPVSPRASYEITANGTPCQLCFLKTFTGVPDSSFDRAGTKIIISSVGAKQSGIVPDSAHYIYVLRKYDNLSIPLPTIVVNGISISSPVTSQTIELASENAMRQNSMRERLISYVGWMSGASGAYSSTVSNRFSVIPVLEGVPYEITAKETPCHLAFLNSFSGIPDSSFDINGSRIVLASVGAKATGTIPTGAKFLYILTVYSNATLTMPEIKVGKIDVISSVYDQIYKLAEYTGWTDAIKMVSGYTEKLLASNANSYYINANAAYPQPFPVASDTKKTTNPIWLRKGDSIKVISPAMGGNSPVLCKADGPVFLSAKFQAINITPTGSGYDTTYDYTIVDEGYYVISWSANYSSAKAYIIYASHNAIDDNTNHIEAISERVDKLNNIGPITNVFGDILPKNFRDKFFGSVEDVEVVCVGDSLTGLVDYSGVLDAPEHQAPGMLYKHWTYQLWDRLCLNKPIYDRLDSQRDDADVFTKVGTWTEYVNNTSGDYGDYSVTANTYKSNSADASVSFVLDLDDYEKCNIVFSANPDGALAEIAIAEGNGKMLASLDKTTWVEANGFQVNEGTENLRERHRRVWMKRATGATGEVNVTFKRSSTDTGSSHYLYCWGTERWNGASLFLTNLGRGGRNMILLGANRMDIFDRNPDLCIFELPLANETVVGDNTLVSLKVIYHDNLVYLRTLSNDYQDTEFLFVLPTGRTQYFSGNQAVEYVSSGTATMKNHLMAKAIFGYVAQLTKNYRENVGMVNLAEQVYNEGLVRGYTLQGWLAPGSIDIPTITRDGVHLNHLGSTFWTKYLAGIFQ